MVNGAYIRKYTSTANPFIENNFPSVKKAVDEFFLDKVLSSDVEYSWYYNKL